jgi:hypothetical protein
MFQLKLASLHNRHAGSTLPVDSTLPKNLPRAHSALTNYSDQYA